MSRSCGDCTKCCTLLQVPELSKPAGTACTNCTNTGCSIYATKPASCKAFMCMWLAGDLSDEMQPHLSGVVVERLPTLHNCVLALTDSEFVPIPQEIIDFYLTQGVAVIGRGQRVYLPEGMTFDEVRRDLFRVAAEFGI